MNARRKLLSKIIKALDEDMWCLMFERNMIEEPEENEERLKELETLLEVKKVYILMKSGFNNLSILRVYSSFEAAKKASKTIFSAPDGKWKKHDSHGLHWVNGSYIISEEEVDDEI